ncbi:MAG: YfcE family phosphodiesterase [Asgard group archaeon]|nr:YfcE family phosphodiesterase [Asgard group archaeon]
MTKKVFIAGDLHIPSRAKQLLPPFKEILESTTWDYIALTGDLTTKEVLEYFKQYVSNPSNLIACQGNMDSFNLPERTIFTIDSLRIGVFHGKGIYPRGDISQLKEIANEMNVSILLTGHSHQTFCHHDDNHIILNPGTATGASGGSSWAVDAGIMVLSISENNKTVTLHWHRLINHKLKTTTRTLEIK